MSTLKVNNIQTTAGVDQFANLEASSGYQKLPGGLIIQWGIGAANTAVTFPIAFPTAVLNCVVTTNSSNTASSNISHAHFHLATLTTTGFTRTNDTYGCRYIAIGY